MSSLIFEILFYFYPAWPVGPPVARPATNPWAPGLENSIRSNPTGAEPTTARVWLKLVSCKSLSEGHSANGLGGKGKERKRKSFRNKRRRVVARV